MRVLDPDLLDERRQMLEAHLERVRLALPADETAFRLDSPGADSVWLHLFNAIQLSLDMAVFACLHFGTPAPSSYDDAIARLGHSGEIDDALSDRLEATTALREAMVHAPEGIDAMSLYRAARVVPGDLRALLAQLGSRVV